MDASTDARWQRPLHHAIGRSLSHRDHEDGGAGAVARRHPVARTSNPHPNTNSTLPTAIASRYGSMRWRSAGYWLATVMVAGELGLGGIWDIARIPYVRDLVTHLGYPSYFLVLLGTWKVLGAVALLVPRRPLLKEWAYAGAFFTYTGAIVSHLTTGYDLGELPLLAVLTALTVLSWALRPPSRRT
jgi:DoxX-like family